MKPGAERKDQEMADAIFQIEFFIYALSGYQYRSNGCVLTSSQLQRIAPRHWQLRLKCTDKSSLRMQHAGTSRSRQGDRPGLLG